MIPVFDRHGYLPAGIHGATIQEIAERFGRQSELQVQMESMFWLLNAARRAKILRIVINGSFTTDRLEQNDVDCALLLDPHTSLELKAEIEAFSDFPFLQVHVLDEAAFDHIVGEFFGFDRRNIEKGVIELTSWI